MPVTVPPDLLQYVDLKVPVPQRLVAARGLVPLKPEQLVLVYFFLAQAPEAPVSEAAKKSVADLPPAILKPALARAREPELLDLYATLHGDDETLEAIVSNPATSMDTLKRVAGTCGRFVQGILVQNQQRLLADPALSDALLANPTLAEDLRAQLAEFRKEFLGIAEEEAAAGDEGPLPGEGEAPAADMEMVEGMEVLEADDLGLAAAAGDEEDDDFPAELIEESAEAAEKQGNLQALIGKLSIAQKIKLATLGNKAARAFLVKDGNRLVAGAVLRSPRLQEDEIEEFSKNRNLDEQVLRLIANNKTWSSSYSIRKNLCENPKAPPELTMRMVLALNEKDMKSLSKNKNVSTAVRNSARRIIQAKEDKIRRQNEKK